MGKKNWMRPPWNAFDYPQWSLAWNMGVGGDYLDRWREWFQQLSSEEQQVYIRQHPEPDGWFDFYHALLAPDVTSQGEILRRARRLLIAYCDRHHHLGVQLEKVGYYEQALVHFEEAIFCSEGLRGRNADSYRHYARLKRHIVAEMALNPEVRTSWHALIQSEDRVRVDIDLTLSPEEYDSIQYGVFFPSFSGRTWMKYFEHNTLYIHRDRKEPCLFLVTFQRQEELSYRVAETWMNSDPAIPHPWRPDIEPPVILNILIRGFLEMQKRYQSLIRQDK